MTKRTIFIAWLVILAGASPPAHPQSPGARVEPQQVAAALSSRSVAVSPAQVVFPSSVVARHFGPSIEVLSVENMDDARTKVKLRCRESNQCLPFYAIINWASPEEAENAALQWSGLRPSMPGPAVPARQPWLVRAGESATLVLEGQHVRIQLPVICLANGDAGKSIRVTTTDRKKIYRAEVVEAGVLKGGL